MASVEFERVTKIYPNGQAGLRALDLAIHEGELLAVVGPSGCGKSTLLRVLAGLEAITSGTLRIGGAVANQASPKARNVAMVFQDYALYPTMTVRDNLAFPLKMRKLAPAELERRVRWAAELLELGPVLGRRPRELSGGQRQRVAMGRALVREPSVFLLDEPLSNLDAQLRAQVRAEIGALQQRMATTMVYVTHDQVEAMTLGQRIAVLNGGKLQQVATPSRLYDAPANAFVAGFIGSPPMNLFAACWRPQPDGAWGLVTGGQVVARSAAETDGRLMTAGIRPEDLRLAEAAEPGFVATVLACEYLGHETLAHCAPGRAAGGRPWIARLPGRPVLNRGETVRLAVVDGTAVHRFGPVADSG